MTRGHLTPSDLDQNSDVPSDRTSPPPSESEHDSDNDHPDAEPTLNNEHVSENDNDHPHAEQLLSNEPVSNNDNDQSEAEPTVSPDDVWADCPFDKLFVLERSSEMPTFEGETFRGRQTVLRYTRLRPRTASDEQEHHGGLPSSGADNQNQHNDGIHAPEPQPVSTSSEDGLPELIPLIPEESESEESESGEGGVDMEFSSGSSGSRSSETSNSSYFNNSTPYRLPEARYPHTEHPESSTLPVEPPTGWGPEIAVLHAHVSRNRPQPHPDTVLNEYQIRRRMSAPEEAHPKPNSVFPADVPPTLPGTKAPPPIFKANGSFLLGPPAMKAPPPGYEWIQPISSLPAFAVLKAPPPSWEQYQTAAMTHAWSRSITPMKAPPAWLTDYSIDVAKAQNPEFTSPAAFKRPPPPPHSVTHTSDGWPKPFAVKDNPIPKPWTAKQGKFNIFETEPSRRPIQPEPKVFPKPPQTTAKKAPPPFPPPNLPNA